MKSFFFLLLLLVTLAGFNYSPHLPEDKISQFKWLIGTWSANNSEGRIIETWLPMNDSLYSGQGTMFRKTTETVSLGNSQFQRRRSDYYFTPANSTIEYKVVNMSKTSFVAENKSASYPKKISYILFIKDSLHTIWEGGSEKRKDLYFGRVKKAVPEVKKGK